jgi:tetratricopeptide (TPR) repeat protein
LLASIYRDQKQYQKAVDKLDVLLAKDSGNISALMLAGAIHDQAGEYKEEAEALQKILDQNPKISAALNNLAYVDSEHLGKLDEAFDLAQRAHDLLRNDPATDDTFGWISLQKGSYASALELLQASARGLPREPSIQYHLGVANYMLGNTDAAQTAFQRALQISSSFDRHEDCQQLLEVLAVDPQTAGANAQTLLEKRVAGKPDDQIALAKLAAIYQRNGDAGKAVGTYEALVRANPQSLAGTLNLARLYAVKDVKKGYSFARAAYKEAPDNADVLEITGMLAYQNGDYRLAYTLLQQTAPARSIPAQTQFLYAEAAYSMGRIAEAQQLLTNLPKAGLMPAQTAEAQRLASLMALVYTPAQAVSSAGAISDILKSEPSYVPALMVMGVIDEQKGDASAATDQYEKALATFPDFIPAERQLAILYSRDTNKLAQGYAFGTKCREYYPNDAGLAKAMGLILYQQGDFSRAASQLRDVAQMAPDAETFFYLGSAQYQLKNRIESKANLQRALDSKLTDAQSEAARKMLAQLK